MRSMILRLQQSRPQPQKQGPGAPHDRVRQKYSLQFPNEKSPKAQFAK
jgi:hypothetical protein